MAQSNEATINAKEAISTNLCSAQKLDCDESLASLQHFISTGNEKEILALYNSFIDLAQSPDAPWESKHGALMGIRTIISNKGTLNTFDIQSQSKDVREVALDLLVHPEIRVRLSAGKLLGALCAQVGPPVYESCQSRLLELIQETLNSQIEPDPEVSEPETVTGNTEQEIQETQKLLEKLAGCQRRNLADVAQICHNMAGWKNLETNMKALQEMVIGCGVAFQPYVTRQLLDYIFAAMTHANRFIREAGFYVCSSLVTCGAAPKDGGSDNEKTMSEANPLCVYGEEFCQHLAKGLADNWSQVRFAASVATRKFLISLPSKDAQAKFFPALIPRMCLNRYYMTGGQPGRLLLYSQDTWRHVTESLGRNLVTQYLSQVVDYYIEAAEAENGTVREAACACIAELAAKVDASVMKQYVPCLLDTLLRCFQDDSWPVRDGGNDHHPPNAIGAAVAIAKVVKVYKLDALKMVMERLKPGLEGIKDQPSQSESYGELGMGHAGYGLVKGSRDHDKEFHSDKQMCKCDSLTPKVVHGGSSLGSIDRKFKRPAQPWEVADGYVHLIGELSQIPEASGSLPPILPILAEAAQHRHYVHHLCFLETLCLRLPDIAQGLGKKVFKSHLELFFDPIFYALHFITTGNEKEIWALYNSFLDLARSPDTPWESKHGALMGIRAIISNYKGTLMVCDFHSLTQEVREVALDLLVHLEVRVRIAAGELLGALCAQVGPHVYETCQTRVLDLIHKNLERQTEPDSAVSEPEAITGNTKHEMQQSRKLMEKLTGCQRRNSADAAKVFHDTTGWKNLETSMKALQEMIDGCGMAFQPYVTKQLLDFIFAALMHTNRFVRETGYYMCSSLVTCGAVPKGTNDDEKALSASNLLCIYGVEFCQHLAKGLADSCSQVRLAASVATRKFLTSLPNKELQAQFLPTLIPRMCLNRYYMAEGVRLYSQETWRQVAGSHGRHLVSQFISHVVDYYVEAAASDNHAVREAACTCIAELATKVDASAVQPYVPHLLDTLLRCFQDDSWPVRDAACLASGNFVSHFPEESQSKMDALYPLFFNNLQDNIPSVRIGAAVAIASVVKVYKPDALIIVMERLKSGLKGIKDQPSESEKYGDLEKGPAVYGVKKRLRDNDKELHTDKQMYSCGSLAPNMGRGGDCIGGLDRNLRRPPQPWEMADGCVHLLGELSQISEATGSLPTVLPLLAEAAQHHHYAHHICFLETLCKRLPGIAQGLGKKVFKSHLELFFDPIFYALGCENALACSAASHCLQQLSQFLGPKVLKGRVENYNPSYLNQLEANAYIAPF
ncbi:unnamed protein product [Darwinula stevensoni]|uniref:Dynein axonemal assembly factor 5 TPR repeats domain-containing protein n=1 Tax=Darwinula stevensoni TaxID=69355 RepID=A0A7R8WZZ9_9CRUS|nr:unnamed protein product [Darwinula stevensoni]CAG0878691.1 unnamed protein product [Darwinula stevensoni]